MKKLWLSVRKAVREHSWKKTGENRWTNGAAWTGNVLCNWITVAERWKTSDKHVRSIDFRAVFASGFKVCACANLWVEECDRSVWVAVFRWCRSWIIAEKFSQLYRTATDRSKEKSIELNLRREMEAQRDTTFHSFRSPKNKWLMGVPYVGNVKTRFV